MWFVIALIVIGLFLYFKFRNTKSPEEKEKERIEKEKQEVFNFEYPQIQRIVNESVDIINSTKNIDTMITRFDTIKDNIKRLFEIAPRSAKLSFIMGQYNISSVEDITYIETEKTKRIKDFFKDKIDIELNKANSLNNPALKKTQLKKALNQALKALDYLPDDESVKHSISNIEAQIEGAVVDIEKKKASMKEWVQLFKKAAKDGVITPEEAKELSEYEKRAGITTEDTCPHWERFEAKIHHKSRGG